MVFPVIGGDGKPTGYEIDNSLRFNEADDSKLVFDPADDDNKRTMTFSFWMKPAVGDYGGDHNNILSVRPGAGTYNMLVHRTGGELMFEINGTGDILKTNRLFRDPSAWYHIVLAIDTTDGTASNRFKLYVNGTEETSFQTDQRSSVNQNTDMLWGGAQPHQIGGDPTGNYFYGGYLAEMHFVTGSQLAPSSFGETNDNGVWIPKKFAGSHGTNGFFLEFKQTGTSANASGIGADTSGGTNHFTSTNLAATDVTTDTPTNNFATLNPLSNSLQASYSEGNLDEACNDNYGVGATQAFANGKWYWEVKIKAGDNNLVGIANSDEQHRFTTTFGINNYSLTAYGVNGQIQREGSLVEDVDDTYGANDIVGVAVDMDSGTRTVQFYKNGSAFGSAATLPTNWGFTLPIIRKGGSNQTSSFNFGNPSFSISSGNSDANGYGNFEYAVPSGYYALCTKNLAEYG
jgi:hypothetical protein